MKLEEALVKVLTLEEQYRAEKIELSRVKQVWLNFFRITLNKNKN